MRAITRTLAIAALAVSSVGPAIAQDCLRYAEQPSALSMCLIGCTGESTRDWPTCEADAIRRYAASDEAYHALRKDWARSYTGARRQQVASDVITPSMLRQAGLPASTQHVLTNLCLQQSIGLLISEGCADAFVQTDQALSVLVFLAHKAAALAKSGAPAAAIVKQDLLAAAHRVALAKHDRGQLVSQPSQAIADTGSAALDKLLSITPGIPPRLRIGSTDAYHPL